MSSAATYLIRLGGCVACHTNHQAGTGFLAGGFGLQTMFGTFVPPNITSDPQAGIGSWTLAQFLGGHERRHGPEGTSIRSSPTKTTR